MILNFSHIQSYFLIICSLLNLMIAEHSFFNFSISYQFSFMQVFLHSIFPYSSLVNQGPELPPPNDHHEEPPPYFLLSIGPYFSKSNVLGHLFMHFQTFSRILLARFKKYSCSVTHVAVFLSQIHLDSVYSSNLP